MERIEMLLLKAPPGIIRWTFGGATLLIMAVRASRADVTRLLLERGSDSKVEAGEVLQEALLEAVLAGQVSGTSLLGYGVDAL